MHGWIWVFSSAQRHQGFNDCNYPPGEFLSCVSVLQVITSLCSIVWWLGWGVFMGRYDSCVQEAPQVSRPHYEVLKGARIRPTPASHWRAAATSYTWTQACLWSSHRRGSKRSADHVFFQLWKNQLNLNTCSCCVATCRWSRKKLKSWSFCCRTQPAETRFSLLHIWRCFHVPPSR